MQTTVATLHILLFVGSALVSMGLLSVAWNNRRDPVARWFAATLVAAVVWTTGYIFEIVAESLDYKILFANVQYLGVATVSVCWWEMIRRYLGMKRAPWIITGFLWFISAATVAMAFINPADLFRGHPYIDALSAPFPVLHADYGPWYSYAFMPVVGIVNAATITLLVRAIVRSDRAYRRQHALLLTSLLLPLGGTALYVFNLTPWTNYNLTTAIVGFSGLLLAVALFRCRLLGIVPLARDFVVEDLVDGVIVADGNGRIVDMNSSAERLVQVNKKKVIGRPAREVLAGYPALVQLLTSPNSDSAQVLSPREMVVTREGVNRYYGLSSSRVAHGRGSFLGRTVVLHEVTERVRLLEQARELASKDDLTGLANRRRFFDLVSREFERARRYHHPVSLLLLDIDHFKNVNDAYGHRAGDLVLCELATLLRSKLRSTDTLGRFGGEEFAVLLPHSDLQGAAEVADRLRQAAASTPIRLDGLKKEIIVTLSMGVTQFRSDSSETPDTLDAVLERADKALYEAKRLGRNMVVASEETIRPLTHSLRAVV